MKKSELLYKNYKLVLYLKSYFQKFKVGTNI